MQNSKHSDGSEEDIGKKTIDAWLYDYAKKLMSKHGRVYSEYQLDIEAGAFKRAL